MKSSVLFSASVVCFGLVGCASSAKPTASSGVDAAKIVEGEPSYVRGAIDKDAVRQVVRQHLPEVKLCGQYHELLRDSGAKGNVVVGFEIAKSGEVTVTRVAGSTMDNPEVESCVAKAVTGWQFPSPSTDKVEVAFPFSFKSELAVRPKSDVTVEVSADGDEGFTAQPAVQTTEPSAPAKAPASSPSRISDKE